ncbi:MAG: hypothetical protein LBP87_07905 [Planctomycetaceae bacterium]|nr:hypothetical protein [Planctomycetaceae bacterium]
MIEIAPLGHSQNSDGLKPSAILGMPQWGNWNQSSQSKYSMLPILLILLIPLKPVDFVQKRKPNCRNAK